MKKWKFVQFTGVVALIVLLINYNIFSTNVTNTNIKTEQIGQNVALKNDSSPAHYTQQLSVTTRGFVISSSFWEQQVGAALNLWTLSKWAATIRVYPVEPFVVNSNFVLPNNLSHSTSSKLLRFRDYYDLERWNELCSDSKLMPLISWETFLYAKSKQLIIAVILLDTEHKGDKEFCTKRTQHFLNSISRFSTEMNFVVVKKVCFVFPGKSISVHDFNTKLYNDFNPKQVTVWFSVWPGVNNYRIHFKETQYWRNTQSMSSIHPSKRTIADSQNYVHNYMESDFGQYIAVSFRSVKRAKKFQLGGISQEFRIKFFDACIRELGGKLDGLGSNRKMFLSIDLGRFGDNSATKYMSNDLIDKILNNTIATVYKNKITIQEYERSFVTATNGITDDGYVAAVQRTIVENSNCLVLFGGNSNFQRSILINYADNHKSPCVVKVCYIN